MTTTAPNVGNTLAIGPGRKPRLGERFFAVLGTNGVPLEVRGEVHRVVGTWSGAAGQGWIVHLYVPALPGVVRHVRLGRMG